MSVRYSRSDDAEWERQKESPQPPVSAYMPSDREPLPSGLLPSERTALTVARSRLKAGDQPPPFITAVLAMTIDRLLGGEGKVTALDGPKLHAFTRDQLIEAVSQLEATVPLDGSKAILLNAESMADAIIEALETERIRAFRAGVRADAAEVGKGAAREGDWPDRGTAENGL